MATTFDSFDPSVTQAPQEETKVPLWLQSADLHNLGNGNPSLITKEDPVNLDYVTKFIKATVASGTNQLYNAGQTVGNWFIPGEDKIQLRSTEDYIASIDSDLVDFYKQKQDTVDFLGFALSSVVPGSLGVKGLRLLNAGEKVVTTATKTGVLGNTLGRATGLLYPSQEKLVFQAVSDIVSSRATFNVIRSSTLKALGSGFTTNVLEAAAYETAVAATMYNSPVLDQMDRTDLFWNIAIGAGLGGVIGGSLTGFSTWGKIKKTVSKIENDIAPWRVVYYGSDKASASEKAAMLIWGKNRMPDVPAKTGIPAQDLLVDKIVQTKAETIKTYDTELRSVLSTLTKGDEETANALWQNIKNASTEDAVNILVQAQTAGKLAESAITEKELARLQKKVASLTATDSELERFSNLSVRYLKVHGPDAGSIYEKAPTVFNLADSLKKGESVVVKGNTVSAGARKYQFSFNDDWNIFQKDHFETEARYLWAEKSPALPPSGAVISENDLPLLQKARKENITSLSVKLEDGTEKVYDATSPEFTDFLVFKKHDLAYRLENSASQEINSLKSAQEVEAYLKKELKIDFKVVDFPPEYNFIAAHATEIDQKLLDKLKVTSLKQILVSRKQLTNLPIERLVQALKHEQGHSFFQPIVDIGGISVDDIPLLRNELIPISKRIRPELWKEPKKYNYLANTNVDPNKVQSLHELMADAYAFASQHPTEMRRLAPKWWQMFGETVHPVPQKLLDAMTLKNVKLTQEQIAKMVDVQPEILSGELKLGDTSGYFARDAYKTAYTKRLVESGVRPADAAGEIDLTNVPSVIKMSYDRTPVKDMDGNLLEGMAIVQQKQRIYQDSIDRIFIANMPADIADKFLPYSAEDLFDVQAINAPGRSFLGASNSNYTSFGAKAELNGQLAVKARIAAETDTKDFYAPYTYALAKNQAASIEWSVLHQRLRNIPENYVYDEEAKALVPKKLKVYNDKVQAAIEEGKDPSKIKIPEIGENIPTKIPVKNAETQEMIKAYIQRNSVRRGKHNAIQAVRDGIHDLPDTDVFYPIAPNPKNYKHFAFVVDRSVTGYERSRMLYAQNEEQLAQLISLVQKDKPESWSILTKKDAETWYKAIGQFEYEKSIKDLEFDSALLRKGVSAPEIVPTDPLKIVNDFVEYEVQKERNMVNELISAKYQSVFESLRNMGESYTSIATSKKGSLQSLMNYAENSVKNPMADYIRATLGIAKDADYAWWFTPQRTVEKTLSNLYSNIAEVFDNRKSIQDLDKINQMLKAAGYKGTNYDEAINRWANYTAPKSVLGAFTSKANAILATLTLRLDWLNAITNAVGSNVLYHPELRSIIRAIEKGDSAAVGKLTELAKVKLPGHEEYVLSPVKVQARAIQNFFKSMNAAKNPQEAALLQTYRDYGFITHISDQYKYVIDELSLTGAEDAVKLHTKLNNVNDMLVELAQKGEKLTANRFAEEFNRFVAADSARQLMQIAVDHNIISNAEMWANVNTFVRRTQGTYTAALRPAILQGPIGQAVSLFQTYQFNLLQQLFRHVSEGDMKDAMLMMGLQGTIFGLQGLPAFNAINTHILGTMGGNPESKDAYYQAYNTLGKEGGDWLMYGAASNIFGLIHKDLRTNLYTRGDINPRQVTVIPTSFADIPIVNAWNKVFTGLKGALNNIALGGDVWNSILTGVEHASVNRPLAGLAQILQSSDNPESLVFSTSNKGNIIASNDLMSLANLTRLAGGKPFDQAIVADLGYRMQVYAANQTSKKEELAKAIKSTLYKGKTPTQDQIKNFATNYVNMGGDQKTWNQFWMRQITNANQEQSDRITNIMKSPALQKLQVLMGGEAYTPNLTDMATEEGVTE